MIATILFAVLLPNGLPAEHDDPIGRHLFPPEIVLAHQMEIGLDDAQRKAIRDEVQKAQLKFVPLQLDLQGEAEKMTALLDERPVNEARALEEADRIMGLEKEIKKTHLALLVRIKNLLTRDQQARLAQIRTRGER